jgi:hypothetical protein
MTHHMAAAKGEITSSIRIQLDRPSYHMFVLLVSCHMFSQIAMGKVHRKSMNWLLTTVISHVSW